MTACKLFLLTIVRKSELQDAAWDEIDFERAVWTIPKERMMRSKAHNVYLSKQVLDIIIALLCRQLALPAAVPLRCGCATVPRDLQPGHLLRRRWGKDERTGVGTVHGP